MIKSENMKSRKIQIKEVKNISSKDLEKLFLSVEWSSGAYPEKLERAMMGSTSVVTAWEGDRLVGLANVLSDGVMTGYIHYMLVDPAYQGLGIGKQLLEKIKEIYKDFLTLVLVSYNGQVNFYEKCGFEQGNTETPMFLTKLKL